MDLSEDQRKTSDKLSLKLSEHPNILHGSSDDNTESFAAHLSRLCDVKLLFNDAMFDIERFQNNSEKIRNYLKSMIKTVFDLHGHGISVLKLDYSNIVIHNETVKLSGLVYINASDDSKMKDIQSLGRAMKNLTQNNQLSVYLDDLVSLMSDYSDSQQDLLLNHMALKSAFERLSFIDQSSKISLLKGDTILKERYLSAVDAISRSENNSKDWTQVVRGLKGPIKDCFEYEQRASTGYRNTNLDMLRFGRNMVGHLHEHMGKAKYKGKYKGTINEVDYFIMRHFGGDFLSFQKSAYQKGILKYLMPDYTSSSNGPPSSAGSSSSGSSSVAPKTLARPSFVVPPSSAAQSQVSYKSKLLGCN